MPQIEPKHTRHPLLTQNLCLSFGDSAVLHDISIEIPQNRLTVLLGPNGSGKSTLLGAMSRLNRPFRGITYLNGKDIATQHTRDIARKLGILPQSPLLPANMTVYDLVSRGRFPHQGMFAHWTSADENAVIRALEITGTLEFSNRAVETLSGGQRQRCFIAMALAQETDIILFDEPTTYLDLRYQVEVMELISQLGTQHGRTIVAVLHDLNFALQYADYLVFLKNGRIHQPATLPQDCTAELITAVFETPVTKLTNPVSGLPVFLPLRKQGGLKNVG
ncbi:ABC transporter ATP-binding protein [Thalassospira mesophila]|uniref:ABC transporter n=1 Tax=Thalassospira mesophila TaxID=1293891 RepID=A0A1Y2KVJ4_9PROT|nr:ABC transporter ATP-binding protein [Thalassospira mesophila]OSQ35863.1 ABC transporter [Thalassospira mesophila]